MIAMTSGRPRGVTGISGWFRIDELAYGGNDTAAHACHIESLTSGADDEEVRRHACRSV